MGITVLKGNASEIMSIAGKNSNPQGVDSSNNSAEAIYAANEISQRYNCTVVISGQTDYIINKNLALKLSHGHAIMQRVTGMGCVSGAIIAAFTAINANTFIATTHAMATMSIAGELAANISNGPGSFASAFLDQLYSFKNSNFTSLKYEYINL